MRARLTLALVGFVFLHVLLLWGAVPLASLVPAVLGAVALSAMAAALVLAARWPWVDALTGGPDKAYGLHRALGFLAVFGTLGHWALADSLGRGLLPFLTDTAEGAGTFAALALLAMTVAAMVRIVPYHLWKASHMLMGPAFLMGAFHTVLVSSPSALGGAWYVMAGVSALGTVAWAQTLRRRGRKGQRVTVTQATRRGDCLDLTVRADEALPPFRPGQFANLSHDNTGAEAHPFSIAGGDAQTRRFIIRDGGDWTSRFVAGVRPGDRLQLFAPEGRFTPQTRSGRKPQLWLAGGVGITPFLAALAQMTPDQGAPVTLIYCLRHRADAPGLADVQAHAARLPQVTLHVFASAEGAGFTPVAGRALLDELPRDAVLYMCGPAGLKDSLRALWAAAGRRGRIHDEDFDFRAAFDLGALAKRLDFATVRAVCARAASAVSGGLGQLRRTGWRLRQSGG